MTKLLLLLLLPCIASAQCAIEGTVELPKSRTAPVMTKRYEIVTKAGVMSTNPPVAIVYLEGSFPKKPSTAVKQVNQKDFMFTPGLLPVQVGTKVEFPNQDDSYHNVFSFSPAKRFDLGRYRPDEKPIPFQVFDKPGMITLRGIILVLDTPYYMVSGADGSFKLTGLPAGSYKLKAWINSRTTLEKSVELKPGATLKTAFP